MQDVRLRVGDVVLAHVVRERRLVEDAARRRRRRRHEDGARILAVARLETLRGQEVVVLEARIRGDHVRRAVVVVADLHEARVENMLLLVLVDAAVVRDVPVVREIGRRRHVLSGRRDADM